MLYERQSTCVNAKTHILTCIAHSQNITTPLRYYLTLDSKGKLNALDMIVLLLKFKMALNLLNDLFRINGKKMVKTTHKPKF